MCWCAIFVFLRKNLFFGVVKLSFVINASGKFVIYTIVLTFKFMDQGVHENIINLDAPKLNDFTVFVINITLIFWSL